MTTADTLVRWGVRTARLLSPLLGRVDSKVAAGIRGWRGARERFVEWARARRDLSRPLLWIHAPSVGEGLQARAVVEALLDRDAEWQVAYTYFSPSAEGWASKLPADVSGYLPWDLPEEMGPVLEALRPSIVAFTKTEVWPTLSSECERRGIPTVFVAATLPPSAGRAGRLGRFFLSPAFRRLAAAGAIAPEDGERLALLGLPADRVEVTGDPGIDSALTRVAAVDPGAPYLLPFERPSRPTLVAGSTWPSDEAVLIPALAAVRREDPRLRLVVAPHEPSEEAVRSLEEKLDSGGWRSARLGTVEERGEAGDADAVIVDRVGVLAPLYRVGTVAYVGGGFHGAGLHSVLEPAAVPLPILFGPRHTNARAAGELRVAGAARMVADSEALARDLGAWLGDPAARDRAAEEAARYMEAHRGAAERNAALIGRVARIH